jgi:hypothetical protein
MLVLLAVKVITLILLATVVQSNEVSDGLISPCNYNGVFRVMGPWAPEASTYYNTPFSFIISLDLRYIHDPWSVTRVTLQEQMNEVCTQFESDPIKVANQYQMYKSMVLDATLQEWVDLTPPPLLVSRDYCLSNLMDQLDNFISAACTRSNNDICVNPTSFESIAWLTGTDKSSSHHNFASFYDEQLKRIQNPSALLEVGVFTGFSLSAWSMKYPCATIIGWDNSVKKTDSDYLFKHPFIIEYADQYSVESMEAALEKLHKDHHLDKFDIILDDGGHTMKMQQNTLKVLWPRVKPCGVFIMEDLQTSFDGTGGYIDILPTTFDVITLAARSELVDMELIMTEVSSVEIFRPSNSHITAAIHKKCRITN